MEEYSKYKKIMKHCLNKIITLILVLTFLVTPLLVTASAVQAAKFDTTLEDFQQDLGGDKYNKETFDFQSLIGVTASLHTMLVGCKETDPQKCPPELSTKNSAMFQMGNYMLAFYDNPPASGIAYFQDIGQNLNLVQPTYAQTGIGFEVLKPFLKIWKASRNLCYILLVLALVIIGLSIMFRLKISPQAVLTIQSALPRVITALILITFSYAIIGLLFDLMYVAFALLVWGLSAGNLFSGDQAKQFFDDFASADFATTLKYILEQGFTGSRQVTSGTLGTVVPGEVAVGVGGLLVALISLVSGVGAVLATSLIPIVLGLALAIIGFLIKVLFNLAKAYLLLLLYLVFAPFFILFSAMRGIGIWEGWLKGVFANFLIFPAVGIVIFLANILITQVEGARGNIWGPPYLGGQAQIIQGMIALGSVILLAQLPEIINQMLSQKGLAFGMPGENLAGQYGEQIQRRAGNANYAWRSRSGAGVPVPVPPPAPAPAPGP